MLAGLSDGILVVDKTGVLTYVNAKVEHVLGRRIWVLQTSAPIAIL